MPLDFIVVESFSQRKENEIEETVQDFFDDQSKRAAYNNMPETSI